MQGANTKELLAYVPKELKEKVVQLAMVRPHKSISRTVNEILEDYFSGNAISK